jgi:hypothetical protein
VTDRDKRSSLLRKGLMKRCIYDWENVVSCIIIESFRNCATSFPGIGVQRLFY